MLFFKLALYKIKEPTHAYKTWFVSFHKIQKQHLLQEHFFPAETFENKNEKFYNFNNDPKKNKVFFLKGALLCLQICSIEWGYKIWREQHIYKLSTPTPHRNINLFPQCLVDTWSFLGNRCIDWHYSHLYL